MLRYLSDANPLRYVVDGVRAASPSLLLTGLLVIAVGVLLDFVLGTIAPGTAGHCRIVFVLRKGSPVCVAALDPKLFKLTGSVASDLFAWPEVEGDVNIHGPLSFVIPSAAAGYEEMHRRWGRLPLAELFDDPQLNPRV